MLINRLSYYGDLFSGVRVPECRIVRTRIRDNGDRKTGIGVSVCGSAVVAGSVIATLAESAVSGHRHGISLWFDSFDPFGKTRL